MLEVHRVTKLFTGKTSVKALDAISFQMPFSDCLVLLGPSGCGKTTLLRLIAGFLSPTEGTISVFGEPVSKPEKRRAYVFQEPRLFPWLTVEKNLALVSAKERFLPLLERMELDSFLRAYPHELSGGMAKRVALARALCLDPSLLLLDEPLANIDVPTRLRLQEEIHQCHASGMGVILVTHDMEEALALATRLIILSTRPGTVLEEMKISLPFPRNMQDFGYQALKRRIINIWRGEMEQ